MEESLNTGHRTITTQHTTELASGNLSIPGLCLNSALCEVDQNWTLNTRGRVSAQTSLFSHWKTSKLLPRIVP